MPFHYKEAISLQELWGLITSSIPLDVAETINVSLLSINFTIYDLIKGFKFYLKQLGNK